MRKLVTFIATVSLLLNSLAPYALIRPVYAEEATGSAQVAATLTPTETPTPVPTVVPTETPVPTLTPAPEATPSPTLTPEPEATASPTPTPVSDWGANTDGLQTTINNVELNKTYVAPQNNKVTVKFDKLPANPGKLSVKEVSTSGLSGVNAVSQTAYDISSDMQNGTFEYTLTLPTPTTDNVEVKASEDGKNFVTVGGVSPTGDTLTITGLNHFTIFVVTSPNPVVVDCTGAGFSVSTGDKCFNTIQEAVNAADSGDTITVAAGTYNENLTIATNVSLAGPNSGVNPNTGTRIDEATISGQVTISAGGTTIDGFTITNPGASGGIYVNSVSDVTIKNNIFQNIGTGISGKGSAQAVNLHTGSANISNLKVENNKITSIGNTSLLHGGSSGSSAKGIYIGDSTGSGTISTITISGNVISNVYASTADWLGSPNYGGGAGAYGVLVNHPTTGLTVTGNTISNLEGLWAHGIGLETNTPSAAVNSNTINSLTDHKAGKDAMALRLESNPSANTVSGSGNTFDDKPLVLSTAIIMVDPSVSTASSNTYPEVLLNGSFYYTGINTFSKIQDGVSNVSSGGTVNVAAGTYAEKLTISKSLTLKGAGKTDTIIQPTSLIDTSIGHKNAADVKAAMLVNGASNVTLQDLTVDCNTLPNYDAVIFWNNSSGNINNLKITADAVFSSMSGHGLAVDASSPSTSSLNVTNTDFPKWNRNAIDAVNGNGGSTGGGNITVNVTGGTFTGRNDHNVTALQNGFNYWNYAGGVVGGTIDGVTVSDLSWNDGTWQSFAIAGPDSDGALVVKNSNFNNVTGYFATGYGNIDATVNNSFDGANQATATNAQLFNIEKKIFHKVDDASYGLVRIKAGNIYVSDNKQIQNGIDAASSGDTVNIAPGTYTAHITINKNLILKGAQAGVDARTRSASDSAETVISTGTNGFTINSGTVTVDGFKFTNTGSGAGIQILGGSGDVIQNNIFSNISNGYASNGIYNSVILQHNRVENSKMGFESNSAPGNGTTIDSNLFTNNSDYDINFIQGGSNIVISNNKRTGGDGNFIVLFKTNGAQVTGNSSSGINATSVFLGGGNTGTNINNNTISSSVGAGVSISNYIGSLNSAITVKNNTLNNNVYGVSVGASAIGSGDTVQIHQNQISGNTTVNLRNLSGGSVDAVGNDWGVYTDSEVASKINGSNVTYIPYIGASQTVLTPTVNLDTSKTQVVVTDTGADSTVNVPSSVTNSTLDVTSLVTTLGDTKTATLPNDITVNAATSVGNVTVSLPAGIEIQGSVSGWNGVINNPTVQSTSSVSVTPPSGYSTTTSSVIEVGYGDVPLTFNKAVRILIAGQAGKLVAYNRAGVTTAITTTCSADDQSTMDTDLPAGGDCKIDVGSDLVIWTKHFTKFVTYTQSQNSDSGLSTPSAPVCNNAKPGSAPVLLSATATAPNEVTLTWSKAADPVTYYLVAFGTSEGNFIYGNPNAGGRDATSYVVKGLSGGTTYYFKVRAGNGCMPGDYSNEIAVTPQGEVLANSIPAGFEQGVLGIETEAQENPEEATSSSVLGAAQTPTPTQAQAVTKGDNNFRNIGLGVFVLLLVIFGFTASRRLFSKD